MTALSCSENNYDESQNNFHGLRVMVMRGVSWLGLVWRGMAWFGWVYKTNRRTGGGQACSGII